MSRLRNVPRFVWLESYLESAGWTQDSTSPGGSWWTRAGRQFALPRSVETDPVEAQVVLSRLATQEKLPAESMFERVLTHVSDVISIRASSQTMRPGWIPLVDAATVVGEARAALRSCASTAFNPKGDLRGNYSRTGDAVFEQATMGHTEDGSFIFPVMLVLPRAPELPNDENPPLFGEEQSRLEPAERRVTRTFAEAMSWAIPLAERGPEDIRQLDLADAVRAGVSRELCNSLIALTTSPTLNTVSFDFHWAKSGPPSTSLPTTVKLDGQATPGLKHMARALRNSIPRQTDYYSGPIISLSHPDDEIYSMTVRAVRNGRQARIEVFLSKEQHDEAIPWYRSGVTVQVNGNVERLPSGLVLRQPQLLGALQMP